MYCPSCGEEILDDSSFCSHCGANVDEFRERVGEDEAEDVGKPEPDDADGVSLREAGSDQESDTGDGRSWSYYVAYIFGLLFLALGLTYLFIDPIAGLLYSLGGAIALPIVRMKLKQKRGISLGRWATVAIVFLVISAGSAAVDVEDTGSQPSTDGGEDGIAESTPEPTEEPTPEPIEPGEEQNRELSNEEWQLAFRLTLLDMGYDVESIERVGNEIELDYYSNARSQEDLAEEMGGIAGAYAAGVDGGWDNDVLFVFILDSNGDIVASYWIEDEWAQAWMDGEYNDEEFFGRILNTFESS